MRYRDRLDLASLKKYAASFNSRARTVGAYGIVDADILRGVILDSGGRCGWCDRNLMDIDFEIDHILSLNQGGANTADNLATTCIACNREKSDKHPARFARAKRAQGSDTALVHRILNDYGVDDAGVQLDLFTDNEKKTPRRPLFLGEAGVESSDSQDEADIPPYRW
jgi:hypothetical protein